MTQGRFLDSHSGFGFVIENASRELVALAPTCEACDVEEHHLWEGPRAQDTAFWRLGLWLLGESQPSVSLPIKQ